MNDARAIIAATLAAELRKVPNSLANIVEAVELNLAGAGYQIIPKDMAEVVSVAGVPTRIVRHYPCTCAGRRGCLEHPFGNPLPDWPGVDLPATG